MRHHHLGPEPSGHRDLKPQNYMLTRNSMSGARASGAQLPPARPVPAGLSFYERILLSAYELLGLGIRIAATRFMAVCIRHETS